MRALVTIWGGQSAWVIVVHEECEGRRSYRQSNRDATWSVGLLRRLDPHAHAQAVARIVVEA
jgi:hypothetical protein